MKRSIDVKLQTGFFERTDFKLKITAEELCFKPSVKGGGEAIRIPTAAIRAITFYEIKRKMEIQTDTLTDAHIAEIGDWQDAMKAAREIPGVKIVWEMN